MKEDKTYIISYDLAEGGDYNKLFEKIQSYPKWAHITESTWAVLSCKSASEIRDEISECLKTGSRLIVVESANVAAWRNSICSNEWLKNNI